ncbi:MAG: metallophosphoesterase [Verrucomicrobiota bacterium]
MKFPKINRRRFFWSLFFGAPGFVFADSYWLEPNWLKVHKIRLTKEKPTHRFVHFTDLHYKGDKKYLEEVVQEINKVSPDFVCLTGDIIEENAFLSEALGILSGIKSPIFGVPGNHDYWSHANFDEIAECFSKSGGAWLVGNQTTTRDGKITLHGAGEKLPLNFQLNPKTKNIALLHYPEWVERLAPNKFAVVLAGHSHGGQVRIPFYGPIALPFSTGRYDLGLFQTESGPLYVSSGIGWFLFNVRFCCRPEIVVLEI